MKKWLDKRWDEWPNEWWDQLIDGQTDIQTEIAYLFCRTLTPLGPLPNRSCRRRRERRERRGRRERSKGERKKSRLDRTWVLSFCVESGRRNCPSRVSRDLELSRVLAALTQQSRRGKG